MQNQSQQDQLQKWEDVLQNQQYLLTKKIDKKNEITVYSVKVECDPSPEWNESSHEDLGIFSNYEDAKAVLYQAINKYIEYQKTWTGDNFGGVNELPREVIKDNWTYQFTNWGTDYEKSWHLNY